MRRISFRNKLFLSYSVVMFSIVVFVLSFFYVYTSRSIETREQENLSRLAQKTVSELDNLFADMDKIALYASTNPNVRSAFQDFSMQKLPTISLEVRIANILSSISVPNSASRFRVSMYNRNANFITMGISTNPQMSNALLESAAYPQWYDALPVVRNGRSIYSHTDDWSKSETPYISVLREVYSQATHLPTGVVQVQAPYILLQNILGNVGADTSAYLLCFEHEQAAYPQVVCADQGEEVRTIVSQRAFSGTTKQSIYCMQPSVYSDWMLILTEPRTKANQLIQPLLILVALLGASTLGLGALFVYIISWEVTRPLRQLSANIENVSLHNLSLQIPNELGRDELAQINDAFKNMFTCLEGSMNEVVQLKAHELQAHMVALQSQMDPHFLFNVIAVIKAMSHEKCNDDIEKVCDYLSDTLRYVSTYSDTSVPLGRELENAENYLRIMKYRFEEKLDYHLEIEPAVWFEPTSVLKLSLQPLLENCFQHAFADKQPPWKIIVRACVYDDRWEASVQDNGNGISSQTVESLFKQAEEFIRQPSEQLLALKLGGMGLVNTLVRLKLRYREQMVFRIETPETGGTIITIGGVYDDTGASGRG